MHRKSFRASLPIAAVAVAAVVVAGCSSGGSSSSSTGTTSPVSSAPVTIKAVLPPNTGAISSAENAGLKLLTDQYEAAHKNVTVDWLPNNSSSITASNAQVETQASGGAAPDLVSGAVRTRDLRQHPGRPAAEHEAVPGKAQPVRAGKH